MSRKTFPHLLYGIIIIALYYTNYLLIYLIDTFLT